MADDETPDSSSPPPPPPDPSGGLTPGGMPAAMAPGTPAALPPPAPSGNFYSGAGLPPRPPGTSIASQQQPAEPTRADHFRKMLGTFFYAAGQGLANAGTGPAANMRGAGAALMAPQQLHTIQQQLEIQRQQAGAMQQYREAQAQAMTPSIRMIDPNGNEVLVPPNAVGAALGRQYSMAGTLGAAGMRAQAMQNVQGMKGATAEDIAGKQIAGKKEITEEQLGSKEKIAANALQEKRNEFYSSDQFKRWKTNADNETKQRVASLQQSKAPAAVMQSAIFANSGLARLSDMDSTMEKLEKSGTMGSLPKNWIENWVFGKGAVDPTLPAETRQAIGQLRAAADLTSSATMRAHTGRTSKEIYDDFKNMLGPGQDWNALRGAMGEVRSTLGDYAQGASDANIMQLRTGGGGGGTAAPAAKKGPLTENEAMDYLRQAGGDKNKARALAKKDGRSF